MTSRQAGATNKTLPRKKGINKKGKDITANDLQLPNKIKWTNHAETY